MEQKQSENWFMESETFKEMNRLMDLDAPFSEEVNGDEFIAEFMRPDKTFKSEADELKHLRTAQAILRDEILGAYDYMDRQGALKAYKEYRDGEE